MTWKVWGTEDELAFEYIAEGQHVIVSFDREGGVSYAIRRGDHFEPGKYEDFHNIADEINATLTMD